MEPNVKAGQLIELLKSLTLDEEQINALIEKKLSTIAKPEPEKIVITPNAGAVTVKGHQHPMFKKVLKLVMAGQNVLLIGPAGCGKSYLTEQLAAALNYLYGVIHGTAGASESHIQGWLLPIGANGQFAYVPAEFVELWEKGNSLFCFDELDAFDPNMLIVVNGALAGGMLHIPQRYQAPHVKRGANAHVIGTANTFGTGADILYAGRNQLDAATLDRFYPIMMDYDRNFESKLAPQAVYEWAWRMREKVQTLKLRRVISTRTIMKMAAAINAGIDFNECKRDMLTGWTRDELSKVGELQS